MKVVTAGEMRDIDRTTIRKLGMSSLVLMERAGKSVADRIVEIFDRRRVVIISGGGNNGGDGIVTGRILKNRGWDVRVLLLISEDRLSPDCLSQYRLAREMKLDIEFRKRITENDVRDSVIVDAMLGTGLNKPVQGTLLHAISAINRAPSPVVAVDIPSGVSSDDGRIMGQAVRADYTVTFGLPKLGHFLYPGAEYRGRLFVEDIGFPEFLLESDNLKHHLTDAAFVGGVIRKRRPHTHKGTYGHVLVLAGSRGRTGAALLAARGCMRAGAGAVTMGVPESLLDVFQARVTEEMTLPLPDDGSGTLSHSSAARVIDFINDSADAVLVGPGLGVSDDLKRFVAEVVAEAGKPLLIDADGLNCLAADIGVFKKVKAPVVITPHPGEMARLLNGAGKRTTAKETDEERVGVARDFASDHGVTCVLKGAPTITAFPDRTVFINTTGNPGMATAGSGDVLAGIVAAFLAQGVDAPTAAACGVYLHGLAGDRARDELGEYSLIAGDLIEYLPRAFKEVVDAG